MPVICQNSKLNISYHVCYSSHAVLPHTSCEAADSSFEPLEDSQVKVIGDDLVPCFIRVQEVSTVIYRIQLRRHIRIRQPSVEVEYCVEGSGSANEIIYTLYRCYSLWLCVCACCCVLCADCENQYAETEEGMEGRRHTWCYCCGKDGNTKGVHASDHLLVCLNKTLSQLSVRSLRA